MIGSQSETIVTSVEALALPDSINQMSNYPESLKCNKIVLINSFDYVAAIKQSGPEWHSYQRPNSDLRFVANLYRAAVGIASLDPKIANPLDLKGKRIAVPPRPSAVRVLIEALLRDGWGILNDVELVDSHPAQVSDRLNRGEIDATACESVLETADGYEVTSSSSMKHMAFEWIEVESSAVDQMNSSHGGGFKRSPVCRNDTEVGLLNFDQGLSAWQCTEPEVVFQILNVLISRGIEWANRTGGVPFAIERMIDWPDLTNLTLHEGANQFYRNYGIQL